MCGPSSEKQVIAARATEYTPKARSSGVRPGCSLPVSNDRNAADSDARSGGGGGEQTYDRSFEPLLGHTSTVVHADDSRTISEHHRRRRADAVALVIRLAHRHGNRR